MVFDYNRNGPPFGRKPQERKGESSMKKALSLLLATALALLPALTLAEETDEKAREESTKAEKYVYKDAVSALPACWNPLTSGDASPGSLLRGGLYAFLFNDALHPIEGQEPFSGCVIVPEMAAAEPVDVTEQVKNERPEFGIPAAASEGYAFAIDLNPACAWEDGTPINADTYVYSMLRLLDPNLQNSRAADFCTGDLRLAGAEAYAHGGRTEKTDNGLIGAYTMESLVKGTDGKYRTEEGFSVYLAVDYPLDWTAGYTLKNYVDAYGDAYFTLDNWEALLGRADDNGLVPLTDDSFALFASVTTGHPAWGENEGDVPNYFIVEKTWPEADFDAVGLLKTGDYQITLVLETPLTGDALMRALTGGWLIKQALYEADRAAYCTSAATTASCGPYKLESNEPEKSMRFVRNEAWYGYQDGKHVYVDPASGETRDMYMADVIDMQALPEAADRLQLFLQGQAMEYTLQSGDFAAYRGSDRARFIPAQTVFFLVLGGNLDALGEREEAKGFDAKKYDLQTLTLPSFRKALSLSIDRDAFAAAVSPARKACYGLIGDAYLYDAENGLRYRDTEPAGDALDAAYDSAADAAKAYYQAAFSEALAAGFITDKNGDRLSDQSIQIEYAADGDSLFLTRVVECLNEQLAEAAKGTPFRNRVSIVLSKPCGDAWSSRVKNGLSDAALMGWLGDFSDPYALMDFYVNPAYAPNVHWADANGEQLTFSFDDGELTASLKDWCDALNGRTVTIGEKEYCFSADKASPEARLMLLAALEEAVLCSYDFLPMAQDGSMVLLSRQIDHVTDQYHPTLGFGGVQYDRFNYDEGAWQEYVNAQRGGTLTY